MKSMRVKILEIRQFKGHNSKEFTNYQVSFEGKKVWISELAYTKHPDLLSVEDEFIILKEPVQDNFILNYKENKNGIFLTLTPKQAGLINIVEVLEDTDVSTDLESNQNNSETLNREENLESEEFFDFLDMLGDKGEFFKSIDRLILCISQLQYDDFECIENFRIHPTLGVFYKGIFDNPKIIQLIKQQINRVVSVLKNIVNDIQKVKSIIETRNDTVYSANRVYFICETLVKLNRIQSIIEKTTSQTDIDIIVFEGKRLWQNLVFIKNRISAVLEETKAFNCFKFQLEDKNQLQGLLRLEKLSDKFSFSNDEGDTLTMSDDIIQELIDDGNDIDRLLGSVSPNIGLPDGVETKKSDSENNRATYSGFESKADRPVTKEEKKKEGKLTIPERRTTSKKGNFVIPPKPTTFDETLELPVKKGRIVMPPKPTESISNSEVNKGIEGDTFIETPENKGKKRLVIHPKPDPKVETKSVGDKTAFINGLLKMSNRKDVSEKTRERVIDLVSKEAVGNDLVLREIQNDVNEIKKYIIRTPEPPTNTKQPILHNPKTLVEYLYKFSFDENLKWLTHEKENDFDYVIILDEAKKTFESFKKTLIPMHTYFNIQNFIIGNKNKKFPSLKLYGNKNIYLDWSTEEVLEWCKENPGVYPNDMPIPKEKQYPIASNKNFILLTFSDVIKEFKHFIEIRTDDEQRTFDLRLSDLMRRLGLYTDFNKPEFNELFKSVNVYTDTNLLFQGFEQIFNWCFDHRAKSNRIDISIESENEFYTLKIKHIGSKIGYEKESSKLNGLGGDLNKVRKCFFNICDWEIHAKLSDGKSYRIELLNSNVNTLEKTSLITEVEPVDGVIHIVKLYKQ
jgi:hypothetical protein